MIIAVDCDGSIGFLRSADGCSFVTVATVAANMRILFSLRASTAIFLDELFGAVYCDVLFRGELN